jgi:hypothetical protein
MNENNLDKLLRKYISIWIWSILFGTASALTYSIFSTRPFERWGTLSVLFVAIYAYLIVALILAWLYLYKYLVKYILPKFFPLQESEQNEFELNKMAFFLKRSFTYLFIAAFLRILMPLIESLLYLF